MPTLSEDFSKAVFGSEKRLAILAAIARATEDDCYPTRIAEMSGAPANAVSQLMAKLVAAKLLTVVQPKRGETLKRHVKGPSALWDLADRLHAELSD